MHKNKRKYALNECTGFMIMSDFMLKIFLLTEKCT